jgi:hypothetical protein
MPLSRVAVSLVLSADQDNPRQHLKFTFCPNSSLETNKKQTSLITIYFEIENDEINNARQYIVIHESL